MASKAVIIRTLEAIANNHNKPRWWIDDSIMVWMDQLEDVSDSDLIQGTKELLRTSKQLPTVARLREVMVASTQTKVGDPVTHRACKACNGTGMRQLVRWFRMHGKQKVWSGVAACDCEKGRVLAMGAFPVWSDVVNQWKADDFTDKIFFGTHKEPHISFKDSVLPEVYERSQARSEDASL